MVTCSAAFPQTNKKYVYKQLFINALKTKSDASLFETQKFNNT
jgi:hypothetical protein